MGASDSKKRNLTAIITYAVAFVCLLCGFLIPLNHYGLLAMQIPDALGQLIKADWAVGKPFVFKGANVGIFGFTDFNLFAALFLLYALITFIGLIAVIPVVIGGIKGKSYANGFARFVEITASVILTIYVLLALTRMGAFQISYSMLIALGGTLAATAVHAIIEKKGGGVIKLILFLLAAIAAIAMYDLPALISAKVSVKFAELAGKMKSASLIFGSDTGSVAGISLLTLLIEAPAQFKTVLSTANITGKILYTVTPALTLWIFISCIIDVIGLGTKSSRGAKICNCLRYAFSMLLIILVIVLAFIGKFKPGVMLYVLAVVTLAQLIINIVRAALATKKKKRDALYSDVPDNSSAALYAENRPAPMPARVRPMPSAPAPMPAPMPVYGVPEPAEVVPEPVAEEAPAAPEETPKAETVVETHNVLYTVNTIYHGPTDDFIKKLTNEEKIEFSQVFLERSKGNLSNLPAYTIGGDNKKFFSGAFIYLGRWRDLVSDGLMNKMYNEMNTL